MPNFSDSIENPLNSINKDTDLLFEVFKRILNKNTYIDTVNEGLNQIKRDIAKKNSFYYTQLSWLVEKTTLLTEFNKELKSIRLKCNIQKMRCNEANKKFESKIVPVALLEFKLPFECQIRGCDAIFENEDDLKKHKAKNHPKGGILKHKEPKYWKPLYQKDEDKKLTIFGKNSYCVYVPLSEIIERSGLYEILNKKSEMVNLRCGIWEMRCNEANKKFGSEKELVELLEFEPAFKCPICDAIFENKEDLDKHMDNVEKPIFTAYIEDTKSEEKQRMIERIRKAGDRTRGG